MNKKSLSLIIILALVILVAVISSHAKRVAVPPEKTFHSVSNALYLCDGMRTIKATYMEGLAVPPANPTEPPHPGGRVDLVLGDGRSISLPQTISGSGIRYASGDESIVYFSKGRGAFMMENNKTTYAGCVEVRPDAGDTPKAYASSTLGFSLRYPTGYIVNERYVYSGAGPEHEISGVSFIVSPLVATGTNLGSDSYISIESIPNTATCSADLFLDQAPPAHTVVDGDATYSVASMVGAGAGNRYDETVYAIPGTNPCRAIRYYVHYSVFENYPPGTVKEFDITTLKGVFDKVRSTLVLL